jgi:hypothetical protein
MKVREELTRMPLTNVPKIIKAYIKVQTIGNRRILNAD